MVRHMALDCMYLRARVLSDFFSNNKNKKYPDDLIYTDIVNVKIPTVSIDNDTRDYINKGTAHISLRRGKLSFDNTSFFNVIKNLVIAIHSFLNALKDDIKTEFKDKLQGEDIEEILEIVEKRLNDACICMTSNTGE